MSIDFFNITLDFSAYSFEGYLDILYHFLGKLIFWVHNLLMIFIFFIYPITILAKKTAYLNEFKLRFIHLVLIFILTINTIFGIECQLTTLEKYLMVLGDLKAYEGGFVTHYSAEYIGWEVDNWLVRIIAFVLLSSSYLMFWRRPLNQSRNFEHWAKKKFLFR